MKTTPLSSKDFCLYVTSSACLFIQSENLKTARTSSTNTVIQRERPSSPKAPHRSTEIDDLFEEFASEDPAFARKLSKARTQIAEDFYPSEHSMRAFRLKLGLSQKELAKLVDTSQSAIANIESGKTRPRTDTIAKIAEALKCTTGDLTTALNAEATRRESEELKK